MYFFAFFLSIFFCCLLVVCNVFIDFSQFTEVKPESIKWIKGSLWYKYWQFNVWICVIILNEHWSMVWMQLEYNGTVILCVLYVHIEWELMIQIYAMEVRLRPILQHVRPLKIHQIFIFCIKEKCRTKRRFTKYHYETLKHNSKADRTLDFIQNIFNKYTQTKQCRK